MSAAKAVTVEEYINQFPEETRKLLNQLRSVICKYAPDAKESISYVMPAYKLRKKPLVYFAGYENHIGFYATPNGHEAFSKEFANYKQGKGSVQFPLNEKLPVKLIAAVVKYRVKKIIEGS